MPEPHSQTNAPALGRTCGEAYDDGLNQLPEPGSHQVDLDIHELGGTLEAASVRIATANPSLFPLLALWKLLGFSQGELLRSQFSRSLFA